MLGNSSFTLETCPENDDLRKAFTICIRKDYPGVLGQPRYVPVELAMTRAAGAQVIAKFPGALCAQIQLGFFWQLRRHFQACSTFGEVLCT